MAAVTLLTLDPLPYPLVIRHQMWIASRYIAERGIQGHLDKVGEGTVSGGIDVARVLAAVVQDLTEQAIEGIEVAAGEG